MPVEDHAVAACAADDDRIRGRPTRREGEAAAIGAVGERDDVARLRRVQRRLQLIRRRDVLRRGRRRIDGQAARRRLRRQDLVDRAVRIRRVELEVVRRRRRPAERE